VPGMPGWQWVHTPGHTPGHISLFRQADHAMIAGDAFVTVRADSLYKVLTQAREVNGPPRYLTTNWQQAFESVVCLTALQPNLAITGHGQSMSGHELSTGLSRLIMDFQEMAVPSHGKFVPEDSGS
jgi:glyoxylase-like metal-dependent hydrolase (beta-lactamase superfamily II)